MPEAQSSTPAQISSSYMKVGWLRRRGKPWKAICRGDDAVCWSALFLVPDASHCEKDVLPIGEHPDQIELGADVNAEA